MRREMFLPLLIASFGFAHLAEAVEQRYVWSISASDTDPFVNVAPTMTGSLVTLHVWYVCGAPDGMTWADFDIVSPNGGLAFAMNVLPPFLNCDPNCPPFAVGGCPQGPLRAAEFLIFGGPYSFCLVPSADTGINGTYDCSAIPELHEHAWIGFRDTESAIHCAEGLPDCVPISVDGTSWGRIKSEYRVLEPGE